MTTWSFFADHRAEILAATLDHLALVVIAMIIAILIGVPLGMVIVQRPALRTMALGIASIFQTIPSLALFGFLIPIPYIGGLGKRPAIVALVLYALLPILRNPNVALTGIDPAVLEAAEAMGMTRAQTLFRVRFPLALAVILAGIRTATIITIGVATIAAAIGAGGLGTFIFRGVALVSDALILAGAIPTAVMNESPQADSAAVYNRVKQLYSDRFHLEVTEPLGFENTFAMVIRGHDAKNLHLQKISDIAPIARKWRAGVGYEFLERPDGFRGWSDRYNLHFAESPKVMDLGLIYRALVDHQVDIVAGNSTDGLIDSLGLVALTDDRHYFPPYDAVPIVRQSTLARFPQLRAALADLAGKLSAADIRRLNYAVDAQHQDVAAVVRSFRRSKGL